jgi:hypothetical protein
MMEETEKLNADVIDGDEEICDALDGLVADEQCGTGEAQPMRW